MYTFQVKGINDIEPNQIVAQDMFILLSMIKTAKPSVRSIIDYFIISNIINAYRCYPNETISTLYYDFKEKVKGYYEKQE